MTTSVDAERDRIASWGSAMRAYHDGNLGSRYDGVTEFRAAMDEKLVLGDEKYGSDSWGRHDMLAEAMAEMVDLGNYAYLKWRQLREIQSRLDAFEVPRSLTGEDRLGVQPVRPPGPQPASTSSTPWSWAQCGHSHAFGIACSIPSSAAGL